MKIFTKKLLSLIMACSCVFASACTSTVGSVASDIESSSSAVSTECNHSYVEEETKEATCWEAGLKTFTCSFCGDSYTEDIAKLTSHTYTSTISQEATCGEEGECIFTCTVCGDSYTEEIAKLTKHTYTHRITKEPTCKEEGIRTFTCTVCGDSYTGPVDKTNSHSWQEANCVQPKTCSVCKTTSGSVDIYAHTGANQCSACGVNYYNMLKNYVYLYGTQKAASGGGQYWLIEDYVYISGKSYKLSFEYDLNRVLCSIRYNDLWFNMSFSNSSGSYKYSYTDITGNTSDWLNGTLNAKDIKASTTSLPYTSIDCLDGYHSNDYIQLKSCEYLKVLLTALNEFMSDARLGIGTKHFGFVNYPSNGD